MISKESLTIEWIDHVRKDFGISDRLLIEKAIRALLLLEGLVQSGLPFVFKGGTAVMLLQQPPRRISIDIDIVVSDDIDFDNIISNFILSQGFTKFVRDDRNVSSAVSKLHFKLYYSPVYRTNLAEDNILLDVLKESTTYQKLLSVDIHSPFINYQTPPVMVNIPSSEDLFGDKLTAFAPQTTGIPYSKDMEIIKQLYDLGNLFEELEDVGTIEETFHRIARVEMNYRGITGETNQVLEDIYQSALCISTKGMVGNADIEALSEGIRSVNAFVFSERYHIERAIVHASRVAYIAKVISKKAKSIERFENPTQIADWEIKEPLHTKLNKLKKTNPEAFFYWYQIFLLEKTSK